MQSAGFLVPTLTALALYRPAAASLRTVFESALYYSYFRSHPKELESLAWNSEYYLTKQDVLDFHGKHSAGFNQMQASIGLVSKLNAWYSKTSAIVHGQIPGTWTTHEALEEISHSDPMPKLVADSFEECEEIVHLFLLITVAQELWVDFSSQAKKSLLKGMSGDIKSSIGLDTI